MKYLVIISLLCWSFLVLAEDEVDRSPAAATLEPSEQAQITRVRKKIYPGGIDEGDLKIQNQLQNPTRKMSPVQIEDVEGHEPSSND